ncbi:sensor histidine kinase [Halapricum desulfuricans]|nr:histidine kinase N-terminal 7TM domain-containing protein [Halapricum desulfuricans]QSG09611.1 Signal transduction histidine kinase, contains PAS domain [Halapricum desulfuricans]
MPTQALAVSSAVVPLDSITQTGWVVVLLSLAAGIGTLALIWYLSRHRHAPGAKWFMAMLGAQALWVFAYTGGLFLRAPLWRASAETLMWIGIAWLGPLFLSFALVYTGRTNIAYSKWFPGVFVPAIAAVALGVTRPYHSLLWQEFQFAPVFGLRTVEYTLQPIGYFVAIVSLGAAGVGVLLLVGAIVSYGPLYKREAIAVTLSTVPPAGAFWVWMFELGPVPSLNLSAAMFLPHVLLDAYAFVGTYMFETNPTTQRAAERGALNDLEDPLLVVDPDGRVVNMNAQAEQLFDAEAVTLPSSVDALTGADLNALRSTGEFECAKRNSVYAVSFTSLTDSSGTDVGEMLVFYDITTVRRQKQRLSVLGRVLRHNLRNQLNVAQGRAELIEAETTDSAIESHAATIRDANEQLLSIGRRIRDFQQVQDRDLTVSSVDPVALAERVADSVREQHLEATVDIEATVSQRYLETDEEILELVLTNLLGNAIRHTESRDAVAEMRLHETDDETVRFELRDTNDRIPDIEIDTLESTEESALQHGQGIGLWIVTWSLNFIDGEITFEYDDGNVVTVTVPRTLSSATTD